MAMLGYGSEGLQSCRCSDGCQILCQRKTHAHHSPAQGGKEGKFRGISEVHSPFSVSLWLTEVKDSHQIHKPRWRET